MLYFSFRTTLNVYFYLHRPDDEHVSAAGTALTGSILVVRNIHIVNTISCSIYYFHGDLDSQTSSICTLFHSANVLRVYKRIANTAFSRVLANFCPQ